LDEWLEKWALGLKDGAIFGRGINLCTSQRIQSWNLDNHTRLRYVFTIGTDVAHKDSWGRRWRWSIEGMREDPLNQEFIFAIVTRKVGYGVCAIELIAPGGIKLCNVHNFAAAAGRPVDREITLRSTVDTVADVH
jgi:hypothetical protein